MAGAMVAGWRVDLAGFVGLVCPGSKQPARLDLGVASASQPEGLKQASPRMGKVPFAESITLFGAFISGLPGNWHLNSASCCV